MIRLIYIITTLFLTALPLSITSSEGWFQYNHVVLTRETDNLKTIDNWEMYDNGDIWIQKEQHSGGQSRTANLGLIAGNVIITKGMALPDGEAIKVLDNTSMLLQLLYQILFYTIPEGSLTGSRPIAYTQTEKDITVQTTTATGVFKAPWSVQGVVNEQTGIIEFALSFTSDNGADGFAAKLAGTMDLHTDFVRMDGLKKLGGWNLYEIVPEGSQNYTSRKIDRSFVTVEEARAFFKDSSN